MTRARLFGSLLLAGALTLGPAVSVWAQDGDYPITGAVCDGTTDGDGDSTTSFPQGGDIQVLGEAGCVDPAEVEFVSMFITSHAHHIATVMVDEDGGYSASTQVPVDIEPGTHTLRIHEGNSRTLEEAGAEVAAKTITITAAGAPSGLPDTGRDIALLALWGTLTLVLGSVLVGVTWRRWQESKVMASSETAWTNRSLSVGTLEAGEPQPGHYPVSTEWIDPPRDLDEDEFGDPHEDPLDVTAEMPEITVDEPTNGRREVAPELPLEPWAPEPRTRNPVFETAVVETGTPSPQPPTNGHGEGEPEEIARRASGRTSEIIDRLRDEIGAWSR